jgi:hypothetical protein
MGLTSNCDPPNFSLPIARITGMDFGTVSYLSRLLFVPAFLPLWTGILWFLFYFFHLCISYNSFH